MPTSSPTPLAQLFGLIQQETVAIMGSGGKTTLLWYLAQAFREQKVLVTPTTKLFLPSPEVYDRFSNSANMAALSPDLSAISLKGVTLAGNPVDDTPLGSSPSPTDQEVKHSEADGKSSHHRRHVDNPALFTHKITPLHQDLLARQRFLFDKIFMECDGARNLPLKGWSASEPVIPSFTSTVIGVIPLWAIGLQASNATIHRAERFYHMTGCQEGETVNIEHLARAIAHPEGLLAKAGPCNKILFLHSAEIKESASARETAKQLISLLPQKTIQQTSRILVGSARTGWGQVLWCKDIV